MPRNKDNPPNEGIHQMPVPKLSKSRNRALEAIKRLGLKPEIVLSAPEMTQMIKEDSEGGLKSALRAMRFATEDPDITKFLKVYDQIPSGDREKIPWEAVAIKAGLNIKHLTGAIQFAMREHSASRVRTMITSHHPEVIRARIKYAMLPSGEKDRTALDIISGLMPSPKGNTFIGKAIFGGGGKSDKDDDDSEDVSIGDFTPDHDLDALFPPANSIQEKLGRVRQRMLPE